MDSLWLNVKTSGGINPIYYIIAAVVCVALSAFFSASEMALSSANRIRLENLAEDGKKARRDFAEKFPARSLMAHVYALLESRADFYRYSNKFEQRKGTEDMLYAFLVDMGYEMSTEEKEMLNGGIINAMNERCPKK